MTESDRAYVWRPEQQVDEVEPDPAAGFLGRWSRRKAESARGNSPEELPADTAADQEADAEDLGQRIDPRTGKCYDELMDEDMPAMESLDTSSDLSMFMAKNISPALRMKALSRVFHQPKYNVVCLCAEYAEDYTSFEPLGSIVPHDMKSAIVREADKLRKRLLGRGEEITPEEAEARIIQETRGERPQDFPDADELRDNQITKGEPSGPEQDHTEEAI